MDTPDLRSALASGEIRLEYQPEFDLHTRKVVAVEALARWDHPSLGALRAEGFVRLAEQSGEIGQLGTWALWTACEQRAAWGTEFAGLELVIRVNVSPAQVSEPGFSDLVWSILDKTGLKPTDLGLEITERTDPDDPDAMTRAAQQLRDSGVHIALDDFGIGHSGLLRLRDRCYDMLKIDKAFVTGLDFRSRDSVIVGAIIELAQQLQLEVVAEGIEASTSLAELVRLGCRRGQGYYLAEPADAVKIAGLLGLSSS